MQIQLGEYILEAELDRLELEDLVHSKANKLSTDILLAVKDQVLDDMREAIENNDIQTAAKLNGYLKCIEDFSTLFSVSIPESLKAESFE